MPGIEAINQYSSDQIKENDLSKDNNDNEEKSRKRTGSPHSIIHNILPILALDHHKNGRKRRAHRIKIMPGTTTIDWIMLTILVELDLISEEGGGQHGRAEHPEEEDDSQVAYVPESVPDCPDQSVQAFPAFG